MQRKKYKYIIIGGGLSGLTSGFEFNLSGENSFKILEARDRLGGRINTQNEVDLGATWMHYNHSTIFNLLEHMKLGKFEQYNTGESYYKAYMNAPTQIFQASADEVPSYRIKGGSSALIEVLDEQLKDHVELETVVKKIAEHGNCVVVTTNKGEFEAEQVIVTVPPRLASTIEFLPKLPTKLIDTMLSTHSWFSHAIKVGLTYNNAFWRENDKSGMIIASSEVITELYDHSNAEEGKFGLMGFANEQIRPLKLVEQKEKILSYLEQFLGSEVYDYVDFQLKDWSKEEFTTGDIGIHAQRSTVYGNLVFQKSYYNGKLHFSGTETSTIQGGYLEGAVYRGVSLAQELMNTTSNR